MKSHLKIVNGYQASVYANGYSLKEHKKVFYVVPDYVAPDYITSISADFIYKEVDVELVLDIANLHRDTEFNDEKFMTRVLEFYDFYGCLKGSEKKKLGIGGWKLKKKAFMSLQQLHKFSYGFDQSLHQFIGKEVLDRIDEWDIANWDLSDLRKVRTEKISTDEDYEDEWVISYQGDDLLKALSFEHLLWITNERMNTANCEQCKDFFIMHRSDARFCSTKCRVKANRQYKKEGNL